MTSAIYLTGGDKAPPQNDALSPDQTKISCMNIYTIDIITLARRVLKRSAAVSGGAMGYVDEQRQLSRELFLTNERNYVSPRRRRTRTRSLENAHLPRNFALLSRHFATNDAPGVIRDPSSSSWLRHGCTPLGQFETTHNLASARASLARASTSARAQHLSYFSRTTLTSAPALRDKVAPTLLSFVNVF